MDNHYLGLTDIEVKERIKNGRVNISQDNVSKTTKQIIFEHTFTYFNCLNIFLAMIILSTGRWTNLTFIFVIFTNAIVGIYQELKVKKIIDRLNVVTVKKVKVIRDGILKEIPIEDLVIDDIVYLEMGNQIGTDCVVLDSIGMEVNESMLTGESEPILKNPGDELFSGSFIVAGTAYARVIRVGNENYSTQLVHKAKHKNKASSEMKMSIEKIIKILSVVIVPIGIILFLAQMSANPTDRATAIVKTVAGVIGMIPEGLVLLTSLSFIIGVGKLARKKALIQEMEAIEALARVNALCLDKTGTITTGELKVEDVLVLNHMSKETVNDLMGLMAYGFDDMNATQEALQDYFKESCLEQIDEVIPFSSKRKMKAIHLKNNETYVMGAPEFLTQQEEVLDLVNHYALKGLRILLLAQANVFDHDSQLVSEIHPIALILIRDCIKEDAKQTLAYFDQQAVDVRILSGDNPLTVSRVADLAGLNHADQYIDASTLPEDFLELQKVVSHYYIFGRVKPEQKQLIIKALQAQGMVVGMVGDGVNDVLAIKDADCGIAMASGSDAAKQAAHIVLLDSNFSSMKQIVEEGKTIISNIERVSSLYLTKTIYSTILCLIFAGLRKSYPFTPLQLSLISMLAIGVPSFFLTLEQSPSLLSQGFLKHVISIAVPSAMTIVIYILTIGVLGGILNFSPQMYSTYYYLVAGFISFLVVFQVCYPFNRMRFILSVTVTFIFYIILFFFYDFFGIYFFFNVKTIWVIPICLSSIFVLNFIKTGIHKLYQMHASHHNA